MLPPRRAGAVPTPLRGTAAGPGRRAPDFSRILLVKRELINNYESMTDVKAIIALTDAEAHRVIDQIPKTMATQKSSTGQDIARRKPTEIDYLNGFIVKKAKHYGIETPANQAVYALVKMIEQYNT